jgi:hypothetical protein
MIYTTIIHSVRKKLDITMNEYAIADSIYHLSNSIKYRWNINNTYLADVLNLSRITVIDIKKKLIEKNILNSEWNEITQLWIDSFFNEWNEHSECIETLQPSVKKPYSDCKETLHNNNIYNNINNNIIKEENIKEENKREIISLTDLENLYKEYMKISKMDIRYWYKSKTMLFLEQLWKEYSLEELKQSMYNYFKTISDKKYSLSPKNFFSNNKKWDHYRVFESFLNKEDNNIIKENIKSIWF